MAEELTADLSRVYDPSPSGSESSFMISVALKVVVNADGTAKIVLDPDQVDHIQRCIAMSLGQTP